jgi:ABC-type lipoprotein release transport system permease subunit
MNHSSREQERNASIAIIAIVAALGVLGVVVLMVAVTISLQQQAEAAGCQNGSHAFFQSRGNCFHP